MGQDHEFHFIGSYGMPTAIERVIEAMGYQPSAPAIVEGSRRRGMGFASSMLASGLAKIYISTARMGLKTDGRYELRTGAADIGTVSDTTLRQIAAEVLGTTVDRIDLIAADTREAPFDCGSYASSTLFIGGQTVNLAARALRSLLEETATELVIPPTDLETASLLVKCRAGWRWGLATPSSKNSNETISDVLSMRLCVPIGFP